MSKDIFSDVVDWEPDLSPERQARVGQVRERFSAPASMFRKVRQELGLSQVEAALRLGTTQANVSKIEKRASTDIDQLERLAANTDFEVVVMLRSKNRNRQIILT